jgi:trehalose synthase
MLGSLLPYALGAGIDTRWLVIGGDAEFFTVTKRLHNRLHGSAGDGGELDDAARAHYEQVLAANAGALGQFIGPHDVVILHDPQTAGLIPALKSAGHTPVVWRCHVGVDAADDLVRSAWEFLRVYVERADALVFSRREYVWDGLDARPVAIIAPSIDPFAAKNYDLSAASVADILAAAGVQNAGAAHGGAEFARSDGSTATVAHRAELLETSRLTPTTPVLLQVGRWDRLKDPVGVVKAYTSHIAPLCDAHLVLAGPAVTGVSDDPEGYRAYLEVRATVLTLARPVRQRIHLATLPMQDLEENAVIVNALQRRAQVVAQKSLAEGFGLTVAEAMWKERPVVASRVGGIQDQIVDGLSGSLVEPRDPAAFGAAVLSYMTDPERARVIGGAARDRVREHFLGSRHLVQYLDLLASLLSV